MTIDKNKVNVINGSVVGVHLGTPMQDATPKKPEDNEVYATERNTVTRVPNSKETWEKEPTPIGGGGDVFVVNCTKTVWMGEDYEEPVCVTDCKYEDAEKAVLDGKAVIFKVNTYEEYEDGSMVYCYTNQFCDVTYNAPYHNEFADTPSNFYFNEGNFMFSAEELNLLGGNG